MGLLKKSRVPLIALAALILTGCGPGFPILTGEQDTLIQNVDRLMKENEALKKRVQAIEGGGEGGIPRQMRAEIDELKKKMADANSSVESMRQDFSFVQGNAEEIDRQKEEMKGSIKSLNSAIASLSERAAALENGAKETSARLEALKGASEANEKRLSEALAASDKKAAALEARLASADAPAERKAASEIKPERPAPEELYLKGYRETVDKEYAKATETFQAFLTEYPAHKLAGNAHYWLGEIFYARGDWERAIIEFDKVIKKYPKCEKVAASYLKEGYSFEKIGSVKEARVLLREVIERYPDSPEAGLAKKRLNSLK